MENHLSGAAPHKGFMISIFPEEGVPYSKYFQRETI